MKYVVQLGGRLIGISTKRTGPGEEGRALVTGLVSTEDGEDFVTVMEHLPTMLLNACPDESRRLPSSVNQLVAVVDANGTATVYLNEGAITVSAQAKKSIDAGAGVPNTEVADISAAALHGIDIPDTSGLLFYFRIGWRSALYIDLGPLAPDSGPRARPVDEQLGGIFAYLMLRERFLSAQEFRDLRKIGWFPFAAFSPPLTKELAQMTASEASLTEFTDKASRIVESQMPSWREKWAQIPAYSSHLPFVDTAIERFRESDFLSASSILYPRIEGILRAATGIEPKSRGNYSNMTKEAVAGRSMESALLPRMFRKYVDFVCFRKRGVADEFLSRHSVSHGSAPASHFDKKSSVVAFLILDQLSYFLIAHRGNPSSTANPADAEEAQGGELCP